MPRCSPRGSGSPALRSPTPFGAILGGAFSPTIAEFLSQQYGTVVSVAFYLGVMSLISLVTVLTIKDRSQEPLHSISGH